MNTLVNLLTFIIFTSFEDTQDAFHLMTSRHKCCSIFVHSLNANKDKTTLVSTCVIKWKTPTIDPQNYIDQTSNRMMQEFKFEEAECKVQDAPSANYSGKEIELNLIYGRKLCSPILGYNCQLPDLPTNCISPTILDTSLLHIPIYTHLKIYDLKPVCLPEPPSILSLQFLEGTILSKSSREISLTARLSEEDGISALCSARK